MQKRGEPVVGLGILGIEFEGAAKFLFGVASVPHSPKSHKGQRCVGIGGLRVELNGFLGRGKRIEKSLVRGHGGEFAQQVVAVGQTNVGVGIAGIARNGLSEGVHSLTQALGSALVPVKTTFEVKLLRLAIGGEMQASGRNGNRLSSGLGVPVARDRKSTRLNSSHMSIS